MAKQNFLNGGYYGKLGVTVGQRWKNIRTIRSYVIPANPRTEKQQANRGQFGQAVPLSQLAMQMNYNATCFEHNNFTRWNYRMRTARALQDAGLTDLGLVPLYPIDFTPPFLISSMTIDTVEQNEYILFAIEGAEPTAERDLSVLFHVYDASGQDLGIRLYIGKYDPASSGYIKVFVDNTAEITEYCKARVVSRDDVDSAADMVASPMLDVQSGGQEIRDFNTEILSISKSLDSVTVVFNEPYKNATSSTISGSLHAVSKGAFTDITFDILALHDSGGYFATTIPCDFTHSQEILAFPSGSTIAINEVMAQGSSFLYSAEDVEENFSDDDLERIIEPTFTYDVAEATNVKVHFPFFLEAQKSIGNGACRCSGRLGLTSEVSCRNYVNVGTDGDCYISPNGFSSAAPMREGDYLVINPFTLTQEGVTYSFESQFRQSVINAIAISNWLEYVPIENKVRVMVDDTDIESLNVIWSYDASYYAEEVDEVLPSTAIARVTSSGSLYPSSEVYFICEEDGTDYHVELTITFDDPAPYNASATVSFLNTSDWIFSSGGISYKIPTYQFPSALSSYEEG